MTLSLVAGMGAGVGYVTPTTPGKCNMMIALLRDPQYAMKPKGLKAVLAAILPPTPEWLRHLVSSLILDQMVCLYRKVHTAVAKGLLSSIRMLKVPLSLQTISS